MYRFFASLRETGDEEQKGRTIRRPEQAARMAQRSTAVNTKK